MKTKQKYYHLIKPIIFVLFLSFSMASCEKEDIIPESPDIEDTENPTDTDPNEIVPPIVRANNEQTIFMYLPWSNNLTSNFYQNISDLESVIEKNILKNERVIVFMCTEATEATLLNSFMKTVKACARPISSILIPYIQQPKELHLSLMMFGNVHQPNVTL